MSLNKVTTFEKLPESFILFPHPSVTCLLASHFLFFFFFSPEMLLLFDLIPAAVSRISVSPLISPLLLLDLGQITCAHAKKPSDAVWPNGNNGL